MSFTLTITGLIFTLIGASILFLNTIFGTRHQKIYTNSWKKRYWWMGWRPLYKNTKTLGWKLNPKRKVIVYGFIPPKYSWELIGFLFILTGVILQIKSIIT